jgi:hypothetical protein
VTAPYDPAHGLAALRRLVEVADPPEPWAEYFYALDQHLTNGGELPSGWRRAQLSGDDDAQNVEDDSPRLDRDAYVPNARQLAIQLRATVMTIRARNETELRTRDLQAFLDARASDIAAVADQLYPREV